jgi:hypothetical protein
MNTEQKINQEQSGLLKLSEMLGSVSEACNVMGCSRSAVSALKNGSVATSGAAG